MKEEIYNKNNKDQLHGYQEWYYIDDITLWLRGLYKNGKPINYYECHITDFSPHSTRYFIR